MTGDGTLQRRYRERFGEPPEPDHVSGYWTFLLGAVAGLLAVCFLLVASLYERGSDPYFFNRQLAFTLALLAGPVVGLSVVYLLPLRDRAVTLAMAGLVVCAVAAGAFNLVYPSGWNAATDYSTPIVALYAAGLGLQLVTVALYPLVTDAPARVPGAPARVPGAPAREPGAPARADATSTSGGERPEDDPSASADDRPVASSTATTDASVVETVTDDTGDSTATDRTTDDGPATSSGTAQFEVYEDRGGEHRWRLRHQNGNVVADSGEGYPDRRSVVEAVERVRSAAPDGDTLDYDPAGFEVYRDAADEWRWRLRHRNGRLLADSGEGYSSRAAARDGIERVRELAVEEDRFEVYEDAGGEFRWRLTAPNGAIVADSGEGYTREADARDAVERVHEDAPEADALDYQPAAYELYQDAAGEWRWRLRHRNGRVLADSGQGYGAKTKARQGIRSVQNNAGDADVVDVEG